MRVETVECSRCGLKVRRIQEGRDRSTAYPNRVAWLKTCRQRTSVEEPRLCPDLRQAAGTAELVTA
jgi:hypothetical protein